MREREVGNKVAGCTQHTAPDTGDGDGDEEVDEMHEVVGQYAGYGKVADEMDKKAEKTGAELHDARSIGPGIWLLYLHCCWCLRLRG